MKRPLSSYVNEKGEFNKIPYLKKITVNVDPLLFKKATSFLQEKDIAFNNTQLMSALLSTNRGLELLCRALFKGVIDTRVYITTHSVGCFDTVDFRRNEVSCNPMSNSQRANAILKAIPLLDDDEIGIVIEGLCKDLW